MALSGTPLPSVGNPQLALEPLLVAPGPPLLALTQAPVYRPSQGTTDVCVLELATMENTAKIVRKWQKST